MFKVLSSLLLVCFSSLPLTAHEFWIEAPQTTSSEGQYVTPAVFVGEKLVGKQFTFDPSGYELAVWIGPENSQTLNSHSLANGRLAALGDGLHILAVKTFEHKHAYKSESSFLDFVQSVGLDGRVNTAESSVTENGFVYETYRRYSKTLVQFDSKFQPDRRVGLEKEWVREQDGFRLYSGSDTLAKQPSWLFCRSSNDDQVNVTPLETNEDGLVQPILPDNTDCLLNTVTLRRQLNGSWHSDWVSTYFTTTSKTQKPQI